MTPSSKKGHVIFDSRLRQTELILKITKEIVVKFIEMGRVTPASFEQTFDLVHSSVAKAAEKCSSSDAGKGPESDS